MLMSTVHHRAVDLVRREETQRKHAANATALDSTASMMADPGVVVVGEVALDEGRRVVGQALEGLPPNQRQVIELMYFGGLSQTQIAERLSLPLGTVKSRTLLGMRRLRAALGGMER